MQFSGSIYETPFTKIFLWYQHTCVPFVGLKTLYTFTEVSGICTKGRERPYLHTHTFPPLHLKPVQGTIMFLLGVGSLFYRLFHHGILVPRWFQFNRWNLLFLHEQVWGAFFWAYSGIGIVGISQTIVRSRATQNQLTVSLKVLQPLWNQTRNRPPQTRPW